MRLIALLLLLAVLLALPANLRADAVYTYVGTLFTSYACNPANNCPHNPVGSGPLMISFTLPTVLAPDLGTPGSLGVPTVFFDLGVPPSFSATDGFWTIDHTNYDPSNVGFDVVTDHSGNIIQWSIALQGLAIPVNCGGPCVFYLQNFEITQFFTGGVVDESGLRNFNYCFPGECDLVLYTKNVGQWTESGPNVVPEPVSLILFASGMAALAVRTRRR
jgi:hypothetical protein